MKRVRAGGRGGIYTPSDFLDVASRAAVDQALSRLAKYGNLRRLARGLYDFPRVHPQLGQLSPAPDDVAYALAESAVNSLVGKRMVKKQQMRWSLHGAHMLMQVRTAEINGELRDRLRTPFRQSEPNVPPIFRPNPPILRAACPPEKLPVSFAL